MDKEKIKTELLAMLDAALAGSRQRSMQEINDFALTCYSVGAITGLDFVAVQSRLRGLIALGSAQRDGLEPA